jgi:hypothetical protein
MPLNANLGRLFRAIRVTARSQYLDHTPSVIEVVPEAFGVEEFEFLFVVAGQLAQAPIVEQKAPILVDDAHCSRAIVENFAKLTLLLRDTYRRRPMAASLFGDLLLSYVQVAYQGGHISFVGGKRYCGLMTSPR